jgi:hypothetical protein
MPKVRRKGRDRVARIAPWLLAALFLGLCYLAYGTGDPSGGDFAAWYAASEQWQAGKSVYTTPALAGETPHGLPFLLFLAPLTWLDPPWAQGVWVGLSALLLVHAMFLVTRMLILESHTLGTWIAPYGSWIALLLLGPFVHDFVLHRQTIVFCLWWVVLGIYLLSRHRDAHAGCCFGVGAGFSVVPLALLPWLIYKNRIGSAIAFLIAVAVTMALPMAAPGQGLERTGEHYREFFDLLGAGITTESTSPEHQSLVPLVLGSVGPGGVIENAELFENRAWVIRVLGAVLIGLCLLWMRSGFGRRGMSRPGNFMLLGEAGLVLGTTILLSSLTPLRDFVWLFPAAVFLVGAGLGGTRRNRYRAGPGLAVLALMVTLPRVCSATGWQADHGFAAGLLFVVLLLGWAVRGERRVRGTKAWDGGTRSARGRL